MSDSRDTKGLRKTPNLYCCPSILFMVYDNNKETITLR